MSVLSDKWIRKMALEEEMIKPFISKQNQKKKIIINERFIRSMD